MPSRTNRNKVRTSKRSRKQAKETDVDDTVAQLKDSTEQVPCQVGEAEEKNWETGADVKIDDDVSDKVENAEQIPPGRKNESASKSASLTDQFTAHLAAVGSGTLMKDLIRLKIGTSINKVDTWDAVVLHSTPNFEENQKVQVEINHAIRPVLLRSEVGAILKVRTFRKKGSNLICISPSHQAMIESANELEVDGSGSSNKFNAEEVLECVNFSMLSWDKFRQRYKEIALEIDANHKQLRQSGHRGAKKIPIALSLVGIVKEVTTESGPNDSWKAVNLQLCDSAGYVNVRIYSSNQDYHKLGTFDCRNTIKQKMVRCDGCYFGQIDPSKMDAVHASNIRLTLSVNGTLNVVTGAIDARAKAIEADIEDTEQTLEQYLMFKQPIAVGFSTPM